jgi:hypothetical protein
MDALRLLERAAHPFENIVQAGKWIQISQP